MINHNKYDKETQSKWVPFTFEDKEEFESIKKCGMFFLCAAIVSAVGYLWVSSII